MTLLAYALPGIYNPGNTHIIDTSVGNRLPQVVSLEKKFKFDILFHLSNLRSKTAFCCRVLGSDFVVSDEPPTSVHLIITNGNWTFWSPNLSLLGLLRGTGNISYCS